MKKLFKTQSGRFFAGLLAFLVAAAVVCAAGSTGALRWDMTPWRVMTVSEGAMDIIRSLEEDVTIYYLASGTGKDFWVDELARRYDACSEHITYQMVDPASSKAADLIAQAGTALAENSMIVASDKRTAAIAADALYAIAYDQMSYYYYGEYVVQSQKFVADSELANALLYVTRDDLPIIYQLTGHGETALTGMALTTVQNGNIVLNKLALGGDSVPEDAAAVLINAPMSDISVEEANALIAYLQQGGKLILTTGYETRGLSNLGRVTAYYGMKQVEGVVIDAAEGYCYSADYPYYLVPQIQAHEITADLHEVQASALVPFAGAIGRSTYRRSGLQVTPLLLTSGEAFVKTAEQLTTLEQEDGDLIGQQTVAMAAEDGEARVVWYASAAAFDDESIQASGSVNLYLLKRTLEWMAPMEERISFESAELMNPALRAGSGTEMAVYAALFVPALAMLIVGIVMKSRKPRVRK